MTWTWWIIIATVASVALTGAATVFLVLGLHSYVWRPLMDQQVGPGGARLGGGGGAGGGSVGWALVRRLGAANRAVIWPQYEANMRRQLIRGGLTHRFVPEEILAFQELAGVAGLVFGLFICAQLGASFVWAAVCALLFGLYPLLWVSDQVKKRHHLIRRALPYAIDLLTLSVEAGLDFSGALGKVVEKGRAGPLQDELQIVLKHLKMGKTREESLKGLVERVDLAPLSSFVNTLIQADRMGTSLGKVLRAQSSQMRMDRTLRAEKLAAEAPVKMLFPLIACIFPTVFMILFGPIAFAFIYGGAAG